MTVTNDLGGRFCDLLQRLYGFLRLALLKNAEDRVDQHDSHDDDDVSGEFPMILRYAVIDLHACGNDGGNDQNDRHRLGELFQKSVKHGFFFAFHELVLAVFLQTSLRLGFAETLHVGGKSFKHFG